jgi:UDP-GlcNAc:undecaprenyl-phosphate/decaprenyl-phosphate GlcNAc-1-phosphate transferase
VNKSGFDNFSNIVFYTGINCEVPITYLYSIFIVTLLAFHLLLSYFLTGLVSSFALKKGITDDPVILWIFNKLYFHIDLNLGITTANLFWILISVIILVVGGYYDDKYHLPPKKMFVPILASLLIAVIGGGLKIEVLSYPFAAILPNIGLLHSLFAFIWIGFCLTATKFLDGLDGLVTTVGIIGFFSIASVSLFANVNQPLVFGFAMIWAAGLIGFLPYNFPDAKLYLGEGGSEIIGFVVGVLSILSGAKVATSGTVIGWFILDIILVMVARLVQHKNPFRGDRLHWHFRLIDMGLSKLQVLSLTAIIIIITSQSGLFFPTEYKVYVLLSQAVILLAVFGVSLILYQKRKKSL